MATTAGNRLEDLSDAEKIRLRWVAIGWMVGVTLVSGIALALKKPTMDLDAYVPLGFNAFPGLKVDTLTFVVTFTTITGLLALVFKVPAVSILGPWLERKLRGSARTVRLRDVFHPGIRRTVFWGGSLQAFYQMGVIGLIAYLSPSAISAAKACVIIPLALLELRAGLMKPSGARWWLRLILSISLTITGAGLVIFEGGFKLFQGGSGLAPLVALVVLVVVGNGLLAYAEMHEYEGVHNRVAAAPIYSLARIMMYVLTCLCTLVVVGVARGHMEVIWNAVLLCVDRWWLVLPVAVLGAISDTSRICVKVLISATYMYTMLAMAVVIDILLQIPLKFYFPDIYDNVHPGWHTVVVAMLGAVLQIGGIVLHPRPRKRDLPPMAVNAPA